MQAISQKRFSQKTRLNDLSYGINIWTDFSSVLSQFTRLTDRQTDGLTERILIARPRLHSTQRGKRAYNKAIYKLICLLLDGGKIMISGNGYRTHVTNYCKVFADRWLGAACIVDPVTSCNGEHHGYGVKVGVYHLKETPTPGAVCLIWSFV